MKPGRIVLVLMFAFVAVVLPLSAYVTAYVALGEYTDYRGNSAESMSTCSSGAPHSHRPEAGN